MSSNMNITKESILKSPWGDSRIVTKRVKTAAVLAIAEDMEQAVLWSRVTFKFAVYCLMDCDGFGKSFAIADAAMHCGFLHLHVHTSSFKSVTSVALKHTEFFDRLSEVTQDGVRIQRGRILDQYISLFNKPLAEVFDSCRRALVDHSSGHTVNHSNGVSVSQSNRLSIHHSNRLSMNHSSGLSIVNPSNGFSMPVLGASDSQEPVNDAGLEAVGEAESSTDMNSENLRSAWSRFVSMIKPDQQVVIHFDDVEKIIPDAFRPEDGDLFGERNDGFCVDEVPRLAFKAFMYTLSRYISSTPRVLWAFTGNRPNMKSALRLSHLWYVEDFGSRLTNFDTPTIYSVFRAYADIAEECYDRTDEKMKRCMERLVGPPKLLDLFLLALQKLHVRNVDHMYAIWDEIEDFIEVQLKEKLAPGLHRCSRETVEFACLAPLMERLGATFVIDETSKYWDDLVEQGLVRSTGEIRSQLSGSLEARDQISSISSASNPLGTERCKIVGSNCTYSFFGGAPKKLYNFVLPYFQLRRAMCKVAEIPSFLVEALMSLIQCPMIGRDSLGKALECAFVTSLASPRSKELQTWLKTKVHLSPLEKSTEPLMSTRVLFATNEPAIISYDARSQNNTSGTDILFESTLDAESSFPSKDVSLPDALERVSVSARVIATWVAYSASELLSEDDSPKCQDRRVSDVVRMVEAAEQRYKESGQRTIIMFSAPYLGDLTEKKTAELESCLPTKHLNGKPYAKLSIHDSLSAVCATKIGNEWHMVRPYAIFYLMDGSPIWPELCTSVEAIRRNDPENVRESLLQYFLPGTKFTSNIVSRIGNDELSAHNRKPRKPVIHVPAPSKRKINQMDDLFESLREGDICPPLQLSKFKKFCFDRYSVGNLYLLTKEKLVRAKFKDEAAEAIVDHIKATFAVKRPGE